MSLLSRLWAMLDSEDQGKLAVKAGLAIGVCRDSQSVGIRISEGELDLTVTLTASAARRVADSLCQAADALEVN